MPSLKSVWNRTLKFHILAKRLIVIRIIVTTRCAIKVGLIPKMPSRGLLSKIGKFHMYLSQNSNILERTV